MKHVAAAQPEGKRFLSLMRISVIRPFRKSWSRCHFLMPTKSTS